MYVCMFQEMDDDPAQSDRPVLPASAGDLHFEYTPASEQEAPVGVTGSEGTGKAGQEANHAPSPGGYTESRTIFVVSVRGRVSIDWIELEGLRGFLLGIKIMPRVLCRTCTK